MIIRRPMMSRKSIKGGALFDSPGQEITSSASYTGIMYYFVAILIVLIISLTVIHYLVYPMWKLRPGTKGLIPLPGSDDTYKAWQTKPFNTIDTVTTPLGSNSINWSGMLDVILDDPTKNLGLYRILFWRGAPILKQPSTSDPVSNTLMSYIPTFNLCIYMDKITNDLHISVLTLESVNKPVIETILIPNPPTRKALRIGWMLGETFLEVYVNGYLISSKTLKHPLMSIPVNSFNPIIETIDGNAARIQMLQLWNRPLAAGEFKAHGKPTSFSESPITDSAVCSS